MCWQHSVLALPAPSLVRHPDTPWVSPSIPLNRHRETLLVWHIWQSDMYKKNIYPKNVQWVGCCWNTRHFIEDQRALAVWQYMQLSFSFPRLHIRKQWSFNLEVPITFLNHNGSVLVVSEANVVSVLQLCLFLAQNHLNVNALVRHSREWVPRSPALSNERVWMENHSGGAGSQVFQ